MAVMELTPEMRNILIQAVTETWTAQQKFDSSPQRARCAKSHETWPEHHPNAPDKWGRTICYSCKLSIEKIDGYWVSVYRVKEWP